MMSIKTEITIEKGYDKIVLSKEEAEKLYNELRTIFEKENNTVYVPYQRVVEYPIYANPTYNPCDYVTTSGDTIIVNSNDVEQSCNYTIKL